MDALARHGEAIATARAFLDRSGATRVVLLLDRGDAEPTLIDAERHATEITEGDTVAVIPEAAPLPAPKPLPDLRPAPASAIAIDLDTGELAAPIGTIHHLAQAVLALATTFGGRSVATAEFATSDPDLPITLAAREGEPVVLGAGDQQYELGA